MLLINPKIQLSVSYKNEPEQASTHKNVETHAGNVFVTRDLWPKGLIVEHLYVMLGDPSCISFRDIVWKNRETNKQR